MNPPDAAGKGPGPDGVRGGPTAGADPRPYREKIVGEICYALGFSRTGIMRRLLSPVVRVPARRFAAVAARADAAVASGGISGAARAILPELSLWPASRGAADIPRQGPLLVLSNHPGGYDSVGILSCLPRPDVKVLITDAGFTRTFVAASRYFIYVPKDDAGRGRALREAVGHLRSGGAVLVFAHQEVEPDPEMAPGAWEALGEWSRSIELMLRRVPAARVQVVIASGVVMRKFLRHPLVKVRRSPARRQKLAEVLQILWQMLSPRTVRTDVHISFAGAVRGDELGPGDRTAAVVAIARRLLGEHMAVLAGGFGSRRPTSASS
ncbi:MAG TPA: hypothetical protein VMS75_04760 [Terriglobales bacterium]|nr:hypothetical protein [Terriglobales bacterium]